MAQGGAASATLCRYYSSTGQCFYGDKCNYLHMAPTTTLAQAADFRPVAPSGACGEAAERVLPHGSLRCRVEAGVAGPKRAGGVCTCACARPRARAGLCASPGGSVNPDALPTGRCGRARCRCGGSLCRRGRSNTRGSGYWSPLSLGAGPALRDEWEARRRASLQPPSESDPRLRGLAGGIGVYWSCLACARPFAHVRRQGPSTR